jgi:hypothetical protein
MTCRRVPAKPLSDKEALQRSASPPLNADVERRRGGAGHPVTRRRTDEPGASSCATCAPGGRHRSRSSTGRRVGATVAARRRASHWAGRAPHLAKR